jgi:polyphosphate kinase
VLQEANKKSNPLLERLKFLGIVSSNRDEFYRVRVASIKRIIRLGKHASDVLGEDPVSLLEKIQGIAIRQQEQFDSSWKTLQRDLRSQGISFLNERNLTAEQARYVKGFFREMVLPGLTPILLDNVEGFPVLNDRNIYFLVVMKQDKQKDRYALIEIPAGTVSRFLVLPKSNKQILFLDDVIRFCLHDIFFQFHYDSISAFTIKLTRDAELDLE